MRTKEEKETVILFNEEEDTAKVYTHNARIKNKLKKLSKRFPKTCKYVGSNADGGMNYDIDKALVSIRTPYSEERKEKDRKRAIADNRIENCRKQQ